MKQGLLVIDVQNDYFTGGKMTLAGADEALIKINALEAQFLAAKLPIIYIQHIKYETNADFFEVGTVGADLHPQLKHDASSIIVEKQFPNSFQGTTLQHQLEQNGVEQLVICGMMTHMCIRATTPVAESLGYAPIVISDATATRDLTVDGELMSAKQVQETMLAELSAVARLMTTNEFLG
ncbi:cysteine hydrolase [Lactococcus piscium]|uniref:Cysteine hydrolase n=1 Tax=Pseudolactococcus paracarnosus TaxID=2749962 RepID=A0A7L4WF49_9LACT|nr:cysteine hydrolase family protein [Lactococcus paracarnosus]SPC36905.1 Isochorismatase family protein [Lactococcus piscium]MCJ1976878.1 cysteine hydrolase [Lactococcus paracarnosus]MCJ1982736.1 cysteine hydrolase [Lactococcus paracarnosus]MCJ1994877.1 cysteine hydrolase [Lactococcus paracarnosus]QDJ28886.1 isochorismatase [Lactococcus paracarnosus]